MHPAGASRQELAELRADQLRYELSCIVAARSAGRRPPTGRLAGHPENHGIVPILVGLPVRLVSSS